jgi:tetratricopeptide (TPR) repeat protein
MNIKRKTNIIQVSLILIICLPGIFQSGLRSFWSVNFVKAETSNRQLGDLNNLIQHVNHDRAMIWLTRTALNNADYSQAESLIESLAESGNLEASSLLGEVYWSQGKINRAITIWKNNQDYFLLLEYAYQLETRKDLENALLAYETAYEIDPQSAALPLANFYWLTLGKIHLSENILRNSLENYTAQSPYYVSWLIRLGDILQFQEKWDQAEDAYNRSLTIEKSISAYVGRGWITYYRDADIDAAMNEFERAIENYPDSGEGYYAIGQLYSSIGLYSSADKWYGIALEKNPYTPWWYVEKGNNARISLNYNQAISEYTRVVERFPEFVPGYYELAWAHYLNNQYQEAISFIKKALVLSPAPNIEIFNRAADIYLGAGENESAYLMYQEIIKIEPENEKAQQQIEQLEELEDSFVH